MVKRLLRWLFTGWVSDDPCPEYSRMDRLDGLS